MLAHRAKQTQQQPTVFSQAPHLLLGGEKQLWLSVLLKDMNTQLWSGFKPHSDDPMH